MKGYEGEVVFGRYQIRRQIGQGGFARVFEAIQLSLGRRVALKVGRSDAPPGVAIQERFRRDAYLVARLNHPNVVVYHDFGRDSDGDMILVMEYLEGLNLREMLEGGPLRHSLTAHLLVQAANGLQAAHDAGIIHRDVKPSNLFVVSPGVKQGLLKVIDFGILLPLADRYPELKGLTRTDMVVGTPVYLAPEVLLGMRPGPASDQYALALVALRMMTGLPLRQEADLTADLLKRLEAPPLSREHMASLPSEAIPVMKRALHPHPEGRYPSVVDFAENLRQVLVPGEPGGRRVVQVDDGASTALLTRVHGPARERPQPRRDRKWWGGVLMMAIPLLLGLAAWGILSRTNSGEKRGTKPIETIQATVDSTRQAFRIPLARRRRGIEPWQTLGRDNEVGQGSAHEARGRTGAAERFGHLTVNARPWAEVEVDGRMVGRTPVRMLGLRPGRHRVVLSHPELGRHTYTVIIRSGRQTYLTPNLDAR